LVGKFLKITGRIKEQYKLENGKYVVPAPLEDIVCRSHFINQCLLFGDNREFNVLLVVPEYTQIRAWVTKYLPQVPFSGVSPENDRLLLEVKEVQDLISMEIQTAVGVCKVGNCNTSFNTCFASNY
jgi:long-chain acyl-CoA synthetase